jgi:hypothetical protein
MWRGQARRGRAGQAFQLGEPGVADGTTANSLAADRHGPRQDDQAVKTKLLARSCSRILDQGLRPTRARYSRNRPLERPRTRAGLVEGWAGHPGHSRLWSALRREYPLRTLTSRVWSCADRVGIFVSHPKAPPLNDDRLPVMHQPVDQGCCQCVVHIEQGAPFPEGSIRG